MNLSPILNLDKLKCNDTKISLHRPRKHFNSVTKSLIEYSFEEYAALWKQVKEDLK